jgi:Flp pilus assembly protein TadD
LEEAEAAFLVAVDIDNDPTAMSNLSRLYKQLGEPQLAHYYADKTELFRARNPYYLFRLAEKAYAQKDYAQTEKLLEKAIRYRKDEHEFYRLLGLSYLQHGERAKAQRRFKQAADLVDEPGQRERYNHKLHLLADS